MSSCDQCEVLNINGLNCHETGCPNSGSTPCEYCGEALRKMDVWYANDWDGIKCCKECANRQAEFEMEEANGSP